MMWCAAAAANLVHALVGIASDRSKQNKGLAQVGDVGVAFLRMGIYLGWKAFWGCLDFI